MRTSPKEQKLAELEPEFKDLLIKCLKECAGRRRWGLFGQNQHPEAAQWLKWEEGEKLKDLAIEIQQIRSEWGSKNTLVEKYLPYCAERGENLPGEPKRAAKFLLEIEET